MSISGSAAKTRANAVQINPVQEDESVVEVIETGKQTDQRALARSGGADNREFFSGRNADGNAFQHGCVQVTEVHVTKAAGFSLHAGVASEAHEREKLERLCRYITRPAVSTERSSLTAQGNIR